MTSEPTAHETLWWGRLAQTVLALTAAVLLLWGLNEKYLWQDEAQTAVLATRLLQFGKPMGYDLVNLIASDNFLTEDRATIDQRAADPRASIDYHFRLGDFKADTTWKWHPWGQFVVAAASIRLLGHTTFAARLPFEIGRAHV